MRSHIAIKSNWNDSMRAPNAGTSVNQIQRFYARNLPLLTELAKNLPSFGE